MEEVDDDYEFNPNPSQFVSTEKVRLERLLTEPLPTITLLPAGAITKSTHTSGHSEIESELTGYNLCILRGLVQRTRITSPHLNISSRFLVQISQKDTTSEQDVQNLIGKLLEDILVLCSFSNRVRVTREETFVPHTRNLSSNNSNNGSSDCWMIYHEMQPIMVVQVKSPHIPNVLNHPNVIGQSADYMLEIASFYGQRDIFGVTTTGTDWKFHWFPHCHDTAMSDTIISRNLHNQILDTATAPIVSRKVHSTLPISHDDPSLVPLLLSVLYKSVVSPRYPVPLISPDRLYITLSKTSWSWNRLATTSVIDLSNNLTINTDRLLGDSSSSSRDFIVLRYLARQREQLVWLAFTAGDTSSSSVIVIKSFLKEHQEQALIEAFIWRNVYSAACASARNVCGFPSLIMPLVFHMKQNTMNGKPYIDCDLNHWLFPPIDSITTTALPNTIIQLRKTILDLSTMWEDRILDIAREATKRLAKHKIVHDDIEWRHFALKPVFDVDNTNTVTELVPILIDLSLTHIVDSEEVALQQMLRRLDVLAEQVVW